MSIGVPPVKDDLRKIQNPSSSRNFYFGLPSPNSVYNQLFVCLAISFLPDYGVLGDCSHSVTAGRIL
jgi:hypothetical protein